MCSWMFFFFQAEDGIRDADVTGVQTCALPIFLPILGGAGKCRQDRHQGLEEARRPPLRSARSEERRVGKECRSRWSLYHLKKKNKNYNHITSYTDIN